ncbi:hypothetical protein WCLP8_3240011 [uncultured Gammaproteobacteria bacterium]
MSVLILSLLISLAYFLGIRWLFFAICGLIILHILVVVSFPPLTFFINLVWWLIRYSLAIVLGVLLAEAIRKAAGESVVSLIWRGLQRR